MPDEDGPEAMQEEWTNFVTQMNEQLMETMEASAQAQSEFLESWFEPGESGDGDRLSEGIDGYTRAYEVWMEAAQESMEEMAAAAESGDVSPNEFRDRWLDAANDAFKEVVSTEAFAAFTGQRLEEALELRQQLDENAQETLHDLGFATKGDSREIAERLAELERRQKRVERELDNIDEVERKLDRILDHLEDRE